MRGSREETESAKALLGFPRRSLNVSNKETSRELQTEVTLPSVGLKPTDTKTFPILHKTTNHSYAKQPNSPEFGKDQLQS